MNMPKSFWIGIITLFMTITSLNIWRYTDDGSIIHFVSMIISFGMMGWMWRK